MQAETTPRQRLQRLPHDDDGMPRHLHPHGYVIVKWKRSWSERVGAMRGQRGGVAMFQWEVYDHLGREKGDIGRLHPWAHREYPHITFSTFAQAREWCDAHPREGWT